MTYSIVARDDVTGEIGVAVQSQAFNTGAAVPWARPGVGAVATQSFTDRRYGWRGLELLAAGRSAEDVLAALRETDKLVEFRQVGILAGGGGDGAQWTGRNCVPAAGSASGDGWIAQANMVASARVWESMGETFEHAGGSLAERLLAALEAAEAAGGDWRGRGGAGIVVVPAEGEPWDRIVDLRVEEGDGSLVELRRLLERALAYRAANQAAEGRAEIARAAGLPEAYVELAAIADATQHGDLELAQALLRALEVREPRWRDTVKTMSLLPELAFLQALFPD